MSPKTRTGSSDSHAQDIKCCFCGGAKSVLAVCFGLLFLLPLTPVTADEVDEGLLIPFNVPEQRVDLALTQFAEQAGITLLFPSDAIGDVMANRLVGEYSVSEGAEILLAGTRDASASD